MAILDRPLFQRRLTKDELRGYGLPAFANGGVVQKFANGGGTRLDLYKKKIDPETAITDLVEDRPTLPATGMTIPSSVYEQETVTDTLSEFTPELKPIPERKKELMEKDKKDKLTPETSGDRELLDKFKKKSETYRNILKEYGEDDFRTQAFLQLAQFGLNLASAQGSNFLDKVATASRDPLANFAKLAQDKSSFMKELDFLALQKAEGEIAKEEERAFQKEEARLEREQDLRIAMLKEEDKTQIQKIADGLVGKKNPNTGEIYTVETAYAQAMKNYLFEKTPLREEYEQDRFTFYRDQDESVTEAKRLAQEDADAIYGESFTDDEIPVLTSQEQWPTIEIGSKFKIKDKTYEKTGPNPTDYREVE
jgi:hypothetical protein